MVIKYKKPSSFFANFVEHFWEKNSLSDQKIDYDMETILPENYLNLTFSLGSPYFHSTNQDHKFVPLHTPQLAALHTKQNFYKHQVGNHIFGIKFLPGGLYPFVAHDFLELTDVSLDMDLILGGAVHDLAEALYHLPDFESRVVCVEAFLMTCLIERKLQKFYFVQKATNALSVKNAGADIAPTIEQLNTNYKTLSRAFHEVIGIAPKQFAQIQRFERSLQLLASPTTMNYTEIGYKAGYYDQAHFIRAFKKFVHQTPSEYLERIKPAAPSTERNAFLQFLSPEHLLFYQLEVY